MRDTMQDTGLTVGSIFQHGTTVHERSEVVSWSPEGARRASFAEVGERATRLASALAALGVERGDRVATLCWNHQEHLEAYLAVPSMGAVLHTLNLRLFPEQLGFIIEHASDKVIILDGSLVELVGKVSGSLDSVEHLVVIGEPEGELDRGWVAYEDFLAGASADFDWPEVDERDAAAMCYTSGTTGEPKGVVYGHRSAFLHSLAVCSGSAYALSDRDRVLPIVPMFHANAWGLPYASWMVGADLVFPGPHLQTEPLLSLIESERPTVSGAVPAIWNDILRRLDKEPADLSSIRIVACGGSAVPRVLMERFEREHGVRIVQAWGMTETSPIVTMAHPPRDVGEEEQWAYRATAGRPVAGAQVRVVGDDDEVLPHDGESVGELQMRGPWVTGSYYGEPTPEKFHDGWIRSGDAGFIDERGYVHITDRFKDLVKSGGEWISSVELENELMAAPGVAEAAVIAIPDERWDERPLACVVLEEGAETTGAIEDIVGHLDGRVARYWVPESWARIDEVPKTSVGKFDKKVLRAQHERGELDVVSRERAPAKS